ncbi:uncharacterized protein BX664DRAFT_327837 [Halteromyces radiatus]|uniref:uncharacterized protein n=1 Tax=Halteromyces radiatus TaxID=101107 RepID=UPI00221F5FEA|nr:uncharacterized protein BX664DRAFT_327837 [Halteromyces radiatus]KAI8092659.1 hypothetical protein BX664DRAFT_327837 [Halteromyces radiatus]
MFNKLILAATTLLASSFVADASMAPSYPSPGTVWKAGQQYDILWADDSTSPSIASGWKDFKIDFMTGDNNNQIFITNVASNLDGTKISKYTWTAPEVNPNSAIYFFMFTNTAGNSAWTTRFGISGPNGELTPPEHATQPTGEKIPWGVGALASGNSTSSASNSTQSSIASSASASVSVSASSSPVSASSSPSASASPAAASSSGTSTAAAASNKPSNAAGSLTRPLAGVAMAAAAACMLI